MKKRLESNQIPPLVMHPGELLRNEIKERGLTQIELAEKLGISQPFLNGLLREKKKISIELAIQLEEVLGIEAELWVKLQRLFDKIEIRNKTERSLQNLTISSQKRDSILAAMMA
ncbi:MAG: HigA family addiction module antitoxin [Spirosomataceae bacterium]|jgi:addiction module HigA family antidote